MNKLHNFDLTSLDVKAQDLKKVDNRYYLYMFENKRKKIMFETPKLRIKDKVPDNDMMNIVIEKEEIINKIKEIDDYMLQYVKLLNYLNLSLLIY